jgi:hypothetical protein
MSPITAGGIVDCRSWVARPRAQQRLHSFQNIFDITKHVVVLVKFVEVVPFLALTSSFSQNADSTVSQSESRSCATSIFFLYVVVVVQEFHTMDASSVSRFVAFAAGDTDLESKSHHHHDHDDDG